jgi:hypothetical protein
MQSPQVAIRGLEEVEGLLGSALMHRSPPLSLLHDDSGICSGELPGAQPRSGTAVSP